jgi:hypothetical protein
MNNINLPEVFRYVGIFFWCGIANVLVFEFDPITFLYFATFVLVMVFINVRDVYKTAKDIEETAVMVVNDFLNHIKVNKEFRKQSKDFAKTVMDYFNQKI